MASYQLNLNAPIVPDYGLGGFVLRTSLIEIQDLIAGLEVFAPGSYRLVNPFEARYTLGSGEVEIGVDVRNGKIARLVARPGYKGSLFGKILVGMKVAEAFELEPRLYYDEAEETILCRGVPGVALDVSEIDPPPELVPAMLIDAISVTPHELHFLAGQKGNW